MLNETHGYGAAKVLAILVQHILKLSTAFGQGLGDLGNILVDGLLDIGRPDGEAQFFGIHQSIMQPKCQSHALLLCRLAVWIFLVMVSTACKLANRNGWFCHG